MKLKQKVSWHRICREGEYLPPWWWGIGYHRYDMGYSVYYPMPLNWIVQVGMLVKWRWGWFRSRTSLVDFIASRERSRLQKQKEE